MPQLSKKGTELPTSPIRKLVQYSDQAKQRGIEVLHLNIGQPDIAAPIEAIDAVKNSKLNLLPYGPSQGTLSYREKLVAYYHKHGISLSTEDIIVTTGASEALNFALNVICDAGDEIIIPEPFYANYNGFASAASVRVVPVISEFNSQFELPSLENINKKITPKTRAILLCNPSNPTGYVYNKDEVDTLISQIESLKDKYELLGFVESFGKEYPEVKESIKLEIENKELANISCDLTKYDHGFIKDYCNYLRKEKSLVNQFNNTPTDSYGEQITDIEDLVTADMTYFLDKRIIEYTEQFAGEVQNLSSLYPVRNPKWHSCKIPCS